MLELIAARHPTDTVLDRVCEMVEEIAGGGIASIMRYDPERDELTFRNAPTAPACVLDALDRLTPGPRAGSCGSAVYERRMVAVHDTFSDPRWESKRAVAEEFGIRSCWSIPISLDGEIRGTFAISRPVPGVPDDRQRELLELSADLAGVVFRVEREEERTRHGHTLLSGIIESSADPIFVKDLEGKYVLANRACRRLFGRPAEELLGRRDDELDSPAAASGAVIERRVMETQEPADQEVRVVDGDEPLEFLVQRGPLRGVDGDRMGIVGIARDVTELRRIERAMQQTQKLESLGILAGGIAHDFNNLLVGVLSNVSLLEAEENVSPEVLRERLAEMRRAAERATELTGQLLQYAGKRRPVERPLDPRELLEELPDLMTEPVSRRVRLRIDSPGSLPVLRADGTQIRQVLMNLVLNAAESIEGDGEVRVCARLLRDQEPEGKLIPAGARPRGDWLWVEVADDGSGIEADTLGRVFDPFFTTKSEGRGLGLAAALGIVRSHRGFIEVASTPGQGSSFRLWLPAEPAPEPRPALPTEERARVCEGRVLLVEDDVNVARPLARILESRGYRVTVCHESLEALSCLGRAGDDPFDLVVTDYLMRGLDGRELAGRIRASGYELPIVLTSGLAGPDAGEGDPEIDAFLRKPFTIDSVFEAVDAACRRVTT